jgi:hypothetical protein
MCFVQEVVEKWGGLYGATVILGIQHLRRNVQGAVCQVELGEAFIEKKVLPWWGHFNFYL